MDQCARGDDLGDGADLLVGGGEAGCEGGNVLKNGIAVQTHEVSGGMDGLGMIALNVPLGHGAYGERLVRPSDAGEVVGFDAPDRQEKTPLDDPPVHRDALDEAELPPVIGVVPANVLDRK